MKLSVSISVPIVIVIDGGVIDRADFPELVIVNTRVLLPPTEVAGNIRVAPTCTAVPIAEVIARIGEAVVDWMVFAASTKGFSQLENASEVNMPKTPRIVAILREDALIS